MRFKVCAGCVCVCAVCSFNTINGYQHLDIYSITTTNQPAMLWIYANININMNQIYQINACQRHFCSRRLSRNYHTWTFSIIRGLFALGESGILQFTRVFFFIFSSFNGFILNTKHSNYGIWITVSLQWKNTRKQPKFKLFTESIDRKHQQRMTSMTDWALKKKSAYSFWKAKLPYSLLL